jgi:hypothetical protein
VAQQIEGAHLVELLAHPLQQGGFRLAAMVVLEHLPGVGLGLLHPCDQIGRVESELSAVSSGAAFVVEPAVGAEVFADLPLEGDLVMQGHQDVRSSLSAMAVPIGNQPLEIVMGFTANLGASQPRCRCGSGL